MLGEVSQILVLSDLVSLDADVVVVIEAVGVLCCAVDLCVGRGIGAGLGGGEGRCDLVSATTL